MPLVMLSVLEKTLMMVMFPKFETQSYQPQKEYLAGDLAHKVVGPKSPTQTKVREPTPGLFRNRKIVEASTRFPPNFILFESKNRTR